MKRLGWRPLLVPGRNTLVLKTTDPWEFIEVFGELRAHPAQEYAIRRAARMTAQAMSRRK